MLQGKLQEEKSGVADDHPLLRTLDLQGERALSSCK
jgi:hypothetical protein